MFKILTKGKMLYDIISKISNPFLDIIFDLITTSYFLIPIIVAILLIKKKYAIHIVLPIFLAIILTAMITSAIKEAVPTDRPCKVIQDIKFPYCKDSNSFPSRHTAIAFAALPFLSHFRKYLAIMVIYASLVGIGMIYLGQHYPHDVLVGFIIGFGIGYLCLLKSRWIIEKYINISEKIFKR